MHSDFENNINEGRCIILIGKSIFLLLAHATLQETVTQLNLKIPAPLSKFFNIFFCDKYLSAVGSDNVLAVIED